eukprot:Amastigsp_a683705_10.p4 type:complete len:149 gc:universal Amastigsp_a683705_10:45-491(+)
MRRGLWVARRPYQQRVRDLDHGHAGDPDEEVRSDEHCQCARHISVHSCRAAVPAQVAARPCPQHFAAAQHARAVVPVAHRLHHRKVRHVDVHPWHVGRVCRRRSGRQLALARDRDCHRCAQRHRRIRCRGHRVPHPRDHGGRRGVHSL